MRALNLTTTARFVFAITHCLLGPHKYAVFTCYPNELSKTDSQKTVRKFLVRFSYAQVHKKRP